MHNASYLMLGAATDPLPPAAAGMAGVGCDNNREDSMVAIHDPVTLRFYTNVVIVPALFLVGSVGNTLSICVMQAVSFGFPSTKFFISWLAVFDTLYLTGGLVFQTTRTIQFDTDWMAGMPLYPYIHPYIWPYMSTVQTIETWLVVTIAIDRYVALCLPLRAARFCTRRRAALTLVGVIVAAVVLNVPHAFEFQPGQRVNPCTNSSKTVIVSTKLFKSHIYQIVYWSVVKLLLRFVLPFAVLCLVTVRLVVALRALKHARTQRQQAPYDALLLKPAPNGAAASSDASTQTNGTNGTPAPTPAASPVAPAAVTATVGSGKSKEDSVTPTLIAVVVTFAACEMIEFVMHILTVIRWNSPWYERAENRPAQQIANTLGNLLLQVNATVNFLLYVVFAPQFRRALLDILAGRRSCCGGGRRRHRRRGYAVTYMDGDGGGGGGGVGLSTYSDNSKASLSAVRELAVIRR